MSEVQSCHVRLAVVAVGNGVLNEVSPLFRHELLKSTLLALVPSFAPLGNDVRAEVPFHAFAKVVPLEASISAIELRDEQLRHVSLKLVLDDKSTLLNEVNPLCLNPAPMLVTDEKSISLSSSISERCNHQPKITML